MRQCVSFFLNRGPNSVLRTRKVQCHRKGQESVEKERRRTETRLVALSEQRVRHDKCFDRRYAHARELQRHFQEGKCRQHRLGWRRGEGSAREAPRPSLADQAVESTATGKHDLQGGAVAVRNHPSVQFSGGRAHASFPATAGDGNLSRLLEVVESVFPCAVTRFANSPCSSLRVSSHARARALCLTAASAFLSVPLCSSCDACFG